MKPERRGGAALSSDPVERRTRLMLGGYCEQRAMERFLVVNGEIIRFGLAPDKIKERRGVDAMREDAIADDQDGKEADDAEEHQPHAAEREVAISRRTRASPDASPRIVGGCWTES